MGQGTATKQFSLTAYIVMALAFLYQLTVLRSKDKGQGK